MKTVRFLEPAEAEVREAVEYLNAQVEHLGDRFAAEVQAALILIAEHPEIGSPLTRRVKKFRLRTFRYNVSISVIVSKFSLLRLPITADVLRTGALA